MSPPLREEEDRLAMIEALRDGTLQAIATDHAPHTPEEKASFASAPNGSIGMETSLAASITYLVKPGYLRLLDVIRLMRSFSGSDPAPASRDRHPVCRSAGRCGSFRSGRRMDGGS